MRTNFFLKGIFILFSIAHLNAQSQSNSPANSKSGPTFYIIDSNTKTLGVKDSKQILQDYLHLKSGEDYRILEMKNTGSGFTQQKFQQYYKGIRVEYGIYNINFKNGVAQSIGGEYYQLPEINVSPQVSEENALELAFKFVNARQYIWQTADGAVKNGQEVPKGELVICKNYFSNPQSPTTFSLAYKFDIYAKDPLSRSYIYVDAGNGNVIHQNAIIKHADGSAQTRYSGTRAIGTQLLNNTYVLRDVSRGLGIETFNLNNGWDYSSATDFTDSDNEWTSLEHNNAKKDNAALDAHWGAMMTYDYFKNVHNRNSFDDQGAKIKSYVHFGIDYVNAFWDGSAMTYGDGGYDNGVAVDPLTSVDICAHEIGHAVCSYTANLVYMYEPGALNEGLSDIWGATVEANSTTGKSTWELGEDINWVIRSMSNPNAHEQPDTYLGDYWYTGGADNGGVHINSGILNHWYYLLVEGKSGTNDNGFNYAVSAIGMEKASKIVYRMESVYLTANSEYFDARKFSIQAAKDIYGEASEEVVQTKNAWDAVGVYDLGTPPDQLIATTVSNTRIDLSWSDNSDNETGFEIERSSMSNSNYAVVATLDANATQYSDSNLITDRTYFYRIRSVIGQIKSNYSNEANARVGNPPIIMSDATLAVCSGTFLDPGGMDNYQNSSNFTMTLKPSIEGNHIRVDFSSFHLEGCCDYLKVYDGPTTSSSLIGSFNGSTIPQTFYGTSSTGELTFQFTTDGSVTYHGWQASIACVESVPLADLVIRHPSVSNASIPQGTQFVASYWLKNVGGYVAKGSTTKLYLSTNQTFENSDILLYTGYDYTVHPGDSIARSTYESSIAESTSPGAYFLLFIADINNDVNEEDETNNLTSFPITVIQATKDLSLSVPTSQVDSAGAGSNFFLESYIKNEGNSMALSSYVNYYLSLNNVLSSDDILLYSAYGGSLSPDQTQSRSSYLTIPSDAPAGNYYIILQADPDNYVGETDELNNTFLLPFEVLTPTKDLVVDHVSFSSSSLITGQYAEFYINISNVGNAPSGFFEAGYYLSADATYDSNDVLIGTSAISGIANGQTAYHYGGFAIPASSVPGNYFILFVADRNNLITETNENNNTSYKTVTLIAPTIDLTISNTTINNLIIAPDNTFTATTQIFNQGNTTSSSGDLAIYLSTDRVKDNSDILLNSFSTGPIYSNSYFDATFNLSIPAVTVAGKYYILFITDYLEKESETVENNNTTATEITVLPAGSEYFMPTNGTKTITTCTAKIFDHAGRGNYSNYTYGTMVINPAEPGMMVRLTFNSFEVESWNSSLFVYDGPSTSSPMIGAYNSNPGVITANNSSGALTLVFNTGYYSSSGFEAQISCINKGAVDFVVQHTSLSKNIIFNGDAMMGSYTLKNNGTINSLNSDISVYLSKDSLPGTEDIELAYLINGPISANTQVVRDLYFNVNVASPGSYHLIFVADYSNTINELSETNNFKAVPISVVRDIDLKIVSLSISPDRIKTKSALMATSVIKNNGNENSEKHGLSYYLSVDEIFDSSDTQLGVSSLSLNGQQEKSFKTELEIPQSTTAGYYYIIAVADYQDETQEFDENNNVFSQGIEIIPTAPDLDVITVANKDSVYVGDSVVVTSGVSNIGNTGTSASILKYFISSDSIFDANDIAIGQSEVPAIQANLYLIIKKTLKIPLDAPVGNLYFLAVADGSNLISEESETNNVGYRTVYLKDLNIDYSISASTSIPTGLDKGDAFNFTINVSNAGTSNSKQTDVAYYLSIDSAYSSNDLLLEAIEIESILSNKTLILTKSLTIPSNVSYDNYYIISVVDSKNTTVETNEGNNELIRKVVIEKPTGIFGEPSISSSVQVFPNPNNGNFKVTISEILNKSHLKCTLYSTLGIKLDERKLAVKNGSASSSYELGITKGAYILEIEMGDQKLIKKILVE